MYHQSKYANACVCDEGNVKCIEMSVTEHPCLAMHRAQGLQREADLNTAARYHLSIPTGALIAATEPNWPVAITEAVLWRTDAQDGAKATEARDIYPELPRTRWSHLDPAADKRKYYSTMAGCIIRAVRDGDAETAVVLGVNTGVSIARDIAMASDRKKARSLEIDTDAIKINKRKTQLHAMGQIALVSPLSRNRLFRRAALATISTGTVLGVAGRQQYSAVVKQSMADKV
jgi:hypothetical protein